MSSSQIQRRIQAGLIRAVARTGSANSDRVFLVRSVSSGTPLDITTTVTRVELVNAIFANYDQKLLNDNILAGDRRLICDNAQVVKQGDTIEQGSLRYLVVNVGTTAPTSDVLLYAPQVRLM